MTMAALPPTVLFLCADNSIRSQLGEALMRHRAGDRFEVQSAGLAPKPVHPLAEPVLHEIGVEAGSLSSKPIGPFLGRRPVRYAVILSDPDETNAPRVFPFATRTLRWNVGDPIASDSSDAEALERVRRVRDEIDLHVREWIVELDRLERPSSAA
jgi:protein-tyrosine-phosphatase